LNDPVSGFAEGVPQDAAFPELKSKIAVVKFPEMKIGEGNSSELRQCRLPAKPAYAANAGAARKQAPCNLSDPEPRRADLGPNHIWFVVPSPHRPERLN
jgi:hypothetical protein